MTENRMVRNAKIKSTEIGYEDHGVLTAWLYLDYGGSGQGFGGYVLDSYKTPVDGLPIKSRRMPNIVCGYFIMRVLEIVGVDSWEKLPGNYVRVDAGWDKIYRIGNILEDTWFSAEEMKNVADIERQV